MSRFAACFGRRFFRKVTPSITRPVPLALSSLLISNDVPNPLHNSLHNSPRATPQLVGGRRHHPHFNNSISSAFAVAVTSVALLVVDEDDASDRFALCAPSQQKRQKKSNAKGGRNKGKSGEIELDPTDPADRAFKLVSDLCFDF